jgi:hypothetical protein
MRIDDAGFNLNPASPNLNAVPGDPDTLERVAHTQTVDVESDLTRGVADPMVDTHTHLEGAVAEILVDTDDNWLVEDGFIEEDRDPHVELQDPGISRLPRYTTGSRVLHLAAITTTHHPRGCQTQRLEAVNTGRDTDKRRTRRRRGIGATARHATAKRGREGRLIMVIRLSQI